MTSLDENPQDPFEPIAVIGLSALLPDADDITTFWQNILDAKVSFKTVPSDRWIESDFGSRVAQKMSTKTKRIPKLEVGLKDLNLIGAGGEYPLVLFCKLTRRNFGP